MLDVLHEVLMRYDTDNNYFSVPCTTWHLAYPLCIVLYINHHFCLNTYSFTGIYSKSGGVFCFHYSRMCIANDVYHVRMHVHTNIRMYERTSASSTCLGTPVPRQKLRLLNFVKAEVVVNVQQYTWYVSARLSISSRLQCLHNLSCSFKCYSIHCVCQTICVVTSSNFLGRLVQCEHKGWDRGRWVGIYTQRVKTAWLCVGLAVKVHQ